MLILGPEPTNSTAEEGDSRLFRRNTAPLLKAAELVIEAIGDDAANYAVERANLLYRKGDAIGAVAWRRVTPVIKELQGRRRMSGPQLIVATGRRSID